MNNNTCQITTIALSHNNTQLDIVVTVSPGSIVITIPSISYEAGDPVRQKQKIMDHVQNWLDQYNLKVLANYANDLKAITFNS